LVGQEDTTPFGGGPYHLSRLQCEGVRTTTTTHKKVHSVRAS
jgi:hypothetical protein